MFRHFAIPSALGLLALASSASAAIVIDFTQVTGPTPGVRVTVTGTINTAAFASFTTVGIPGAFTGTEGSLFISGTLAQLGRVDMPFDRYVPTSSTLNWFPGGSVTVATGIIESFGDFQLERNLMTGQMNLATTTGQSGILAYRGPASTFMPGTTLAGFGVDANEVLAGPYVSTVTSNGITDSLTFTFNGVPEPSSACMAGLALLAASARRRR